MTKIILLTQWFEPEPCMKGMAFARELLRQGFTVEVVTGFPNYPGGKLYPGYKIRWMQREFIDGVKITRLPLYPSHDKSTWKRALNYLSIALSSFIYTSFMAKKSDVIYAYHPPLTIGVVAVLVKMLKKTPVVYDIQDMWPDTLQFAGVVDNKRILTALSKVCLWVYKHVDKIVVLSPGFKNLLINREIPAEKISVIYNWCDEKLLLNSFDHKPAVKLSPKHKYSILFAGNIGLAQGLENVIAAAAQLQYSHPDICFVFLGAGNAVIDLQKSVHDQKLENVIFLRRVGMQEVGAYLKLADVLLIYLKDDPLARITIPSKTQAYMAIGKPIIIGVAGDAADLVTNSGCGIAVAPGDVDALIKAVLHFKSLTAEELDSIGKRGMEYYFHHLSLSIGVSKFAAEFRLLHDGKLP